MAANDFVYASVPLASDLAVKNTDVVDIKAGNLVKIDAANPVSGTQPIPGVLVGTAGAYCPAVAIENIPVGKNGRVRPLGVAPVVASGVIAAGAVISPAANGQVAAQAAAGIQIGIALTAAAALNDTILALIQPAKNA